MFEKVENLKKRQPPKKIQTQPNKQTTKIDNIHNFFFMWFFGFSFLLLTLLTKESTLLKKEKEEPRFVASDSSSTVKG